MTAFPVNIYEIQLQYLVTRDLTESYYTKPLINEFSVFLPLIVLLITNWASASISVV